MLAIWRWSHLALSILCGVVLLIASVTGVILGGNAAVDSNMPGVPTSVELDLSVSSVIETLENAHDEVYDLERDSQGRILVSALRKSGEIEKFIANPSTGAYIVKVQREAKWVQWCRALHRSLFFKMPGRVIVAAVAFCLLLITLSGIFILLQLSKKRLALVIPFRNRYQYRHAVGGLIFTLPIVLSAITGLFLTVNRFDFFPTHSFGKNTQIEIAEDRQIDFHQFEFLQKTPLKSLRKLSFPVFADGDEPFLLETRSHAYELHPQTGQLLSKTSFPVLEVINETASKIHTGEGSLFWSLIMILTAMSLLYFTWSGFAITVKRLNKKMLNKKIILGQSSEACDIHVLVASETGSTWNFAESFKSIFQETNRNIFICSINDFQPHGGLKKVVILAATTGYGEAPANARDYKAALSQSRKDLAVDIAVVGFGSRAYPLFCQFAEDVDAHLRELNWANVVVPLHTVNNGSLKEFESWCLAWSKATEMPMVVVEEIAVNEPRFSLKIQNVERQGDLIKWNIWASGNFKGNSGDYLVLKTPDGLEERFYSLAYIKENQYKVVFKVHKEGKCSQAMGKLKEGDIFWAKLIPNPKFSIPQDCQNAVLIANGTGIAPFLGFLQELEAQRSIRLYWGCKDSAQRALFKEEFDQAISENRLDLCEVIYSQEGPKQHVQELVKRDLHALVQVLSGGGVVLVCGAIVLQHDIESILETALKQAGGKAIGELKTNGQFLTDCYE